MAGIFRVIYQKYHPPAQTTESFAGKTVLLTGATGGLGLAAAKKLVALNADRLIITARTESKGQKTKDELEAWAKEPVTGKIKSNTEIHVMVLSMDTFDDIKTFAKEVTAQFPKVDAAILNAGMIATRWRTSADGFEETIQVNTLSTTLLGLLLLPKLLESSTVEAPAHLTFVSSGTAVRKRPAAMEPYYNSPNALNAVCEKDTFQGGQAQYGTSKLFLEYSMRHMAKLPLLNSEAGQPRVIVNSTCPGMTKSDLGREFATNIMLKLILWFMYLCIGRSAEQGSNIYISAVTRGADGQGQLWKEDRYYDAGEMITSDNGKKFGDKVWKEIKEVMTKAAPETAKTLA